MKKNFSLLIMFLVLFCAMGKAHCAQNFFSDEKQFSKAKEETKKSWFSFLKKDKEENIEPKGYWGVLPDISSDFKYRDEIKPNAKERDFKLPQDGVLDEENLKPAPFDDTLFLDVIIKKEKTSDYVNDIQKIKFALNNLKDCIEQQGDIQRFNGCVNVLELYTKNLTLKYKDKPESQKESFIEVANTNYYAKVLGNLKYDANYYARYIPTNEGKYSEYNIKFEEENLLTRINKTIFLLNNES